MNRVINFRGFLIVFLSVMLSTLFCAIFIFNHILSIITFIIEFVALLVLTIVYFYKCKFKYAYTFLFSLLCSLIAFIIGCISINLYNKMPVYDDKVTIYGQVNSCVNEDDYLKLTLSDNKINNVSSRGKIRVNIYFDKNCNTANFVDVGDYITFETNLTKYNIFNNGKINGNIFENNIYYHCFTYENSVVCKSGKMNFFQSLHNKIYSLFTINMGKWGNIAYSMFTGNKDGLDDETRNYYNISGIGHILAVSGLHIGFLTLLLGWIFNLMHLSNKLKTIFQSLILILYSFFVGFAPSVVRAVIMAIVGFATYVNGRRRDSLSSLCFAGSIILTFSPLYIFSVGFLMGFTAVLGITLFAHSITFSLKKIKCPRFIYSPLAVSVSAQIGITPIMVYYFNSFSLYSIFTNILLIPLIMLIFNSLFICLILALIIPFCSVFLKFIALLIAVMDYISVLISSLPYSRIIVFSSEIILFSYLIYFFISRFIMLPHKWIYSLVSIILSMSLLFYHNIPYKENATLLFVGDNHEVTSILYDDDEGIIVGDVYNGYLLEDILINNKIRKIDNIFVNYLGNKSVRAIIHLSTLYKIENIYFPKSNNEDLSKLIDSKINLIQIDKDWGGYKKIRANYGNDFECFSYNSEKIQMGFYSVNHNKYDEQIFNKFNIVRCLENLSNDKVYLVNHYNEKFENKYVVISNKGEGKIFKFMTGESFSMGIFQIL